MLGGMFSKVGWYFLLHPEGSQDGPSRTIISSGAIGPLYLVKEGQFPGSWVKKNSWKGLIIQVSLKIFWLRRVLQKDPKEWSSFDYVEQWIQKDLWTLESWQHENNGYILGPLYDDLRNKWGSSAKNPLWKSSLMQLCENIVNHIESSDYKWIDSINLLNRKRLLGLLAWIIVAKSQFSMTLPVITCPHITLCSCGFWLMKREPWNETWRSEYNRPSPMPVSQRRVEEIYHLDRE